MVTINGFGILSAKRTRLQVRLFLVAVVALGLMANWLPQPGLMRYASADNPPTPNEFTIPTGNSATFQITNGPDNNFWFCETKTDKIGRCTPNGLFTEFPLPGGSVPYAITGGPDGNLWFTEQGTNSVGKITPTGAITHFLIPTPG